MRVRERERERERLREIARQRKRKKNERRYFHRKEIVGLLNHFVIFQLYSEVIIFEPN